jgi:hypothetical protein
MPMHDWIRVEPNYFHDFHVGWIAAFRQSLNNGVLPAGYYALAEQNVPPFEPDVLALQAPPPKSKPGKSHSNNGRTPSGGSTLTLTLAAAPPRVRFTAAEPKASNIPRKQRRIAIRRASNHRLVAVIEIVSPGNKANKRDFLAFVNKAISLLEQGIHLLIIDPFPPTARDPNGIHAAIWRSLVRKRFALLADKPLTLAAYAAERDDRFAAYVEPLAVGDAICDMPLFLTPTEYVYAPLEETYGQAWSGFPAPWKEVVEGE